MIAGRCITAEMSPIEAQECLAALADRVAAKARQVNLLRDDEANAAVMARAAAELGGLVGLKMRLEVSFAQQAITLRSQAVAPSRSAKA